MEKHKIAGSRLPLLAGRIFDTPLLVHERKLRVVVGAMGSHLGIADCLSDDILASANDTFLAAHSDPVDTTGVAIAVIPIHGTLVHRGGDLDAFSGLRSYESIRADLREALNDRSISAILFDIDSGGGEAAGCFDLVDEIRAAQKQKPVYAFVNEHAYSAAYAIASAAQKIYVPRTGGVGSVGVVSVHMDQSGWDAKLGVAYTPIIAGARKVDGWPHSPMSDEAKAEWQSSVNKIYDIFTDTVARNRGMNLEAVVQTEARCYMGEDAVAIGFADGIATLDDVIDVILSDLDENSSREKISGHGGEKATTGPVGGISRKGKSNMTLAKLLKGQSRRTGAKKPSVKAQKDDEILDDEEDVIENDRDDEDLESDDHDETIDDEDGDDVDAEEKDDDESVDDGEDKPKESARKSSEKARVQAAKIVDMCTLFGDPARAAGFIRKGMSVSDVQKRLLAEQKSALAAGHVPVSGVHSARSDRGGPQAGERLCDEMAKRFKK